MVIGGMDLVNSGIYARIGTENKDLITECTVQEFRDWARSKGLDLWFMRDSTLDGLSGCNIGEFGEFYKWQIRCAVVADLEAMGVSVYKVNDEWQKFSEDYTKEHKRLFG